GYASRGEHGGLVWALFVGGREVERAAPGTRVLIWFGAERELPELPAGRRVFKNGSPDAQRITRALLSEPVRAGRVSLAIAPRGQAGAPLWIGARAADGRSARVETDVALAPASGAGLDDVILDQHLGRLGGTPFFLDSVVLDGTTQAPLHLPVSALN